MGYYHGRPRSSRSRDNYESRTSHDGQFQVSGSVVEGRELGGYDFLCLPAGGLTFIDLLLSSEAGAWNDLEWVQ